MLGCSLSGRPALLGGASVQAPSPLDPGTASMVRPCCGVQISCWAVFHRWGGCLRFPRGGREHASFPGTAWAPLPFSVAPTGGSLCGASPLLPGQELVAAASQGTAHWGVGHLLRLSCALSTRPPAVFPFSCFRAAFPAEPSAAWSAAWPVLAAQRPQALALWPPLCRVHRPREGEVAQRGLGAEPSRAEKRLLVVLAMPRGAAMGRNEVEGRLWPGGSPKRRE